MTDTDLSRELQEGGYVCCGFLDHSRSRHGVILGWLTLLEPGRHGRPPHWPCHSTERPLEIDRYFVVARGRRHPANDVRAVFAVFIPPDLLMD